MDQNEKLTQLQAAFAAMEPRAYKPNNEGFVKAFTVNEFHLDSFDNPISVAGTVTIAGENGNQTVNVLWNALGQAFNSGPSRPQFDMVKKVIAQPASA